MQLLVTSEDEDQSDKLYLVPNVDYLYPKYYLSYDKMQRDLRHDEHRIRKRIVNYYYSKLIDRWLYHDLSFRDLTKYFTIKYDNEGISVALVHNLDDVKDNHKLSHNERKSILFFIESFMIDKKFVRKVIDEYARRTSSDWIELYQYEYNIQIFIRHALKKKIRNTIKKLSKKGD
jgi:hypothetical protein